MNHSNKTKRQYLKFQITNVRFTREVFCAPLEIVWNKKLDKIWLTTTSRHVACRWYSKYIVENNLGLAFVTNPRISKELMRRKKKKLITKPSVKSVACREESRDHERERVFEWEGWKGEEGWRKKMETEREWEGRETCL